MTIFEKVKAGINSKEAAERYGLEVDRYGKALCPFHNDRHPSLYVDDDHYHCFACGEHGDVIDLTAKLFDLKLYEAAQKLAYDFGVMQDKSPDKAMPEKLHKKSKPRVERVVCKALQGPVTSSGSENEWYAFSLRSCTLL